MTTKEERIEQVYSSALEMPAGQQVAWVQLLSIPPDIRDAVVSRLTETSTTPATSPVNTTWPTPATRPQVKGESMTDSEKHDLFISKVESAMESGLSRQRAVHSVATRHSDLHESYVEISNERLREQRREKGLIR